MSSAAGRVGPDRLGGGSGTPGAVARPPCAWRRLVRAGRAGSQAEDLRGGLKGVGEPAEHRDVSQQRDPVATGKIVKNERLAFGVPGPRKSQTFER